MIPSINSRHTIKSWEEQMSFPNREAIKILIELFPEIKKCADLVIDEGKLDQDIARAKELFAAKTRGGLQ